MRLIDADELCLGKFVEPRTEWHKGWNDALDAAATQAPTIEAEPVKHGKWVCDKDEMEYYCSECGRNAPIGMSSYILHKYCPHCGARMDGEGDA